MTVKRRKFCLQERPCQKETPPGYRIWDGSARPASHRYYRMLEVFMEPHIFGCQEDRRLLCKVDRRPECKCLILPTPASLLSSFSWSAADMERDSLDLHYSALHRSGTRWGSLKDQHKEKKKEWHADCLRIASSRTRPRHTDLLIDFPFESPTSSRLVGGCF